MKVEIGKKYFRRDGKIATVTGKRPNQPFFYDVRYVTDIIYGDTGEYAYVYENGSAFASGAPEPEDFVSEYFDEFQPQLSDYAEILRWIADGEAIQGINVGVDYYDCDNKLVLERIALGRAIHPSKYRVKPKTITVNGVVVPRGETEAPKIGVKYYVPHFFFGESIRELEWYAAQSDKNALSHGVVYLKKEDAIARSKAMLIAQ